MAVCYATGVIGTPIHELSHLVMCLVFFHRIEGVSLFQIGNDGVLGYVEHSYNRKNIYQRIGNYFIGIAPIVLGGLVMLLLMSLIMPNTHDKFSAYIGAFVRMQQGGVGMDWVPDTLNIMRCMIGAFFSGIGKDGLWFIFFILAFCIALHLNLSGADIKGALGALPWLIGILFVVNLVLGLLFDGIYKGFVKIMCIAGGYIAAMLLISLIFSLFLLLIALAVRGIISIVKK